MTKRFAVVGSPIQHSKSPLIHQRAFEFLGVEASYERVEIANDLKAWTQSLDENWHGISVTMPLKFEALELAERVDPLAIAAQSANTLVRRGKAWDAFNTDIMGIQQALSGKKFSAVCVLGTGATARSAIVAMLEKGKTVSVWGRDAEKVQRLSAEFGVESITGLHTALSQPAVISTLTAHALDDQLESEYRGFLLDVVYNPWPTKLALSFPSDRVTSGLEMLLWQAIGQQRLFAGLELTEALPDEANLLRTVRSALNMAK